MREVAADEQVTFGHLGDAEHGAVDASTERVPLRAIPPRDVLRRLSACLREVAAFDQVAVLRDQQCAHALIEAAERSPCSVALRDRSRSARNDGGRQDGDATQARQRSPMDPSG